MYKLYSVNVGYCRGGFAKNLFKLFPTPSSKIFSIHAASHRSHVEKIIILKAFGFCINRIYGYNVKVYIQNTHPGTLFIARERIY